MFIYTTKNNLIIESKQELEKGDVIVVKKEGSNTVETLYVEHIFKNNLIELEPYKLKSVSIKY